MANKTSQSILIITVEWLPFKNPECVMELSLITVKSAFLLQKIK